MRIRQEGNSNQASQDASGDNYSLGVGLITTTQTGEENLASQFASGNGILGTILQTGDLNQASMSQTGDLNVATINQLGNGNMAAVTQVR